MPPRTKEGGEADEAIAWGCSLSGEGADAGAVLGQTHADMKGFCRQVTEDPERKPNDKSKQRAGL